MANTIAAILPKILARGLLVLRERSVMPRLVNSDYSTDAAKKGATIDVPIPTAVGVSDVVPSNVPPVPSDTVTRTVPITLDKWKKSDPIHLTDKELTEIDANEHFLPGQVAESIRALANQVNADILDEYKGVYTHTGSVGAIPFAADVTDATQSRKALNQNRAPKDMRRGVLDFDAEANALALAPFSDADKIMSATVRIEGEIGRKYGIDWVAEDNVPTHTTGATTGGAIAVDNGGGYPAAPNALQSTIHVDGLLTSAADGDLLSFAGHSQSYAVVATDALAGADQNWTLQPGLQAAIADDEVITVVASHKVNLVFHRDAFAYAARPLLSSTLDTSSGLGVQMLSLQDPQTRVILRLEVSRQYKQTVWEFDILYGVKLVRPELAVRLKGQP